MVSVARNLNSIDVAAIGLLEPWHCYHSLKAQAKQLAGEMGQDTKRTAMARGFCAEILATYWKAHCKQRGSSFQIHSLDLLLPALPEEWARLAVSIGELVALFPVGDSGYLIGSLYTVMLPDEMRSDLGAYYTPPPLVNRLLDLAEEAGTDFKDCTVLDPACGGGAFLAPVALRMANKARSLAPAESLRKIATRLAGFEIDPFAAWITQVLVECSLLDLCVKAGKRLPKIVKVVDALQQETKDQFDLVIGNPPYGRVSLDARLRARYSRSLYGHANLYGLFTDLALRLVKPGGVIAYLTPTSFLGGQYYMALRGLIATEITPIAFDFISDRNGVFDDVLQETILVAYLAKKSKRQASVSRVVPHGIEDATVEEIGKVRIPTDGSPWVIPRRIEDAEFVSTLSVLTTRLSDLGYQVSTGQLVWNRHKPQLRHQKSKGDLPIIWAESISAAGFAFSADKRNHAPYIKLRKDQPHLITAKSCILLQRTTAKEQRRRLLSAVIPQKFLDQHGGVVVENHLNIVYSVNKPKVSPEAVSAILNSSALDRAFRSISGSVAVSAYELEALPMPTPAQAKRVEKLLATKASLLEVERVIASFYETAK